MATKRRKVRKTRKRSCKNGKLKKPIKTKSGRKRRCKKRKTKSKRRRKYKMMSLNDLSARNVADNLRGDIDERIQQISNSNLPYNTKIYIINQLENDKQIISEFYYAERENDKEQVLIEYLNNDYKNKVDIVLKYYPEYG